MRAKHVPVQNFGGRLKQARELRGLSQKQLSETLGVPPSSVAHFEGGRRKPSFESLLRLADALDVTTDYLLSRSNTPTASPILDPLAQTISSLSKADRELLEAILAVLTRRRIEARR